MIRLLAISDRRRCPVPVEAWCRELVAAGVDALQLREKDLDDRALYELAVRLRELAPPPFRLLVNGRADLALAAGADGVHLPSSGVSVAALRQRFGKRLLIGRSTHRAEEIDRAREEGADYVTFGPVWATPGKERYGPPAGSEALRAACGRGLPVLALGGLSRERLSAAAASGATGAAGIRLFFESEALPELVATARRLFPSPLGYTPPPA